MAEVVVVTGARGLLGSRVVAGLAGRHEVVALVRRAPEPGQADGVRWVVHDLSRPVLPPDLPAHVDVVVHLAQSRHFRSFPEQALDVYGVNVTSTTLLLDWALAHGAHQFVLASSGSVYDPGPAPHVEDEAVALGGRPSYYAASRLAAELLARAYGDRLVVTVLRPFFMYGRHQGDDMLLPRLVESIRAGRPVTLDGADGMRFNPLYVSDAAAAVQAALALEQSCVVNLAGPEILSIRQAADVLGAQLGVRPVFENRLDMTPTDVIGDVSRMTVLLGAPHTTLAHAAADAFG